MKPDLKGKFSRRYLKLEKKLPLEKFIPAAFLIFLLIVFILSIITYHNIDRYKSDISWVNNSNEILKKVEDINVNTLEIPLVRRGYIITGEVDYLYKYDSLMLNIHSQIITLKKLASIQPEQYMLVNSLDSLSELNLELTNAIVLDSIKYKYSAAEKYKKQIEVENEVQKNLMYINKIIQELKFNELSYFKNENKKAERINSTIQDFIIAISIFSFIVIGLSLFISERLIKNKSKAEDLLMKSYEEMESRVEDRTEKLREANEKLSNEVSVRKKIEDNLRESEYRFRIMADSAPVLIWMTDNNKQFSYFNREWLNFTGRTMEEESGYGWLHGMHPDDLQKCIQIYEDSFDKRIPFDMEFRLKNNTGEYIWIYSKGTPRYEGNYFAGYTGSCTDINERIKNEKFLKIQYEISKTLSESKTLEEASNKLLENICTGMDWDFGILWTLDDNHEFVKINSLWGKDENSIREFENSNDTKKTFSKDKGFQELLDKGKSVWKKDMHFIEDPNFKYDPKKMGWISGLEIPISSGTEIIAMIECLSKKSIEERLDFIAVLESAARQIGNFIERKKAENRLLKSNLELEENVKIRTAELVNALSKLIKESEEKEKIQNKIKLFAHTIKSMKDSVFIADQNNNILFVNEAFEQTYGFEDKELIGKEVPILKDIIPEIKNKILKSSFENGWKGELLTKKYDGTNFYTYLSTSAIKNDDGSANAWVGICQDMTEIKKAEDLILKRNNLLLVLNDVISYTNNIFDLNSGIQYSINKICEYTHWEIGHCFLIKNDKFVSSKIWNKDMPESSYKFKEISENLIFNKGEGYPGKKLLDQKSEWIKFREIKEKNVILRLDVVNELGLKTGIWVPIFMNNEIIGILEFFKIDEEEIDPEILNCINNIGIEIGSLYDKIETINKIRQSENKLNDAQHIAKLGNWEWDVINNKITWSDELYRIFGVKRDDFKPTFENYLSGIHESDVDRVQKIIQNALINKTTFDFYHRLKSQDGKEKIINSQGEIHLDEDNNVIRMFGTAHDVTEIRQAEEELRIINAKLIATQKELIYNEKLAALGRFSSGVAHEIRNPLANISSLAQMITKADIDVKNKRRLNYIITNVDIANKIIKSLLNFASPGELKYSSVNVIDILENIIESVEARCKSSDINVIFDSPDEIPTMNIDKLKLEAALMNFVSNAIEAMNEGGDLTIKVRLESESEMIRIEFIDTGIGIPAENLDKILEPFFTTKDEGVGLGMGLAYQTIKSHHGTYEIESVLGKGTTIKIKFPLTNNKL